MEWREIFEHLSEKRIIVGALIVATLMAVFPPWRTPIPDRGISVATGYYPIFIPPNPIASVDLARLSVQWAIVGLLAGIVVAIARKGSR